MKVLVNGGLNLSEIDGWWAEAYSPEVGWALDDGKEHPEPEWDSAEADQLYSLLEQEVIPTFYEQDPRGIPRRWVAKMRASMARLTSRFSSNRMVRECTESYYVPAHRTCRSNCSQWRSRRRHRNVAAANSRKLASFTFRKPERESIGLGFYFRCPSGDS